MFPRVCIVNKAHWIRWYKGMNDFNAMSQEVVNKVHIIKAEDCE
jgi:hypothetical protein